MVHVSAVSRKPDQLDVFTVAPDGRVETAWWPNADWANWRPIGGFFPAGAPVAAVARKADQLDLFVVGNDGRVYTSWWGGGNDWSGVNDNWRAIGGFFPVGAPLSAVARTPNNLDVFVVGNDGRVYTSWWSGANDWSGINDNWRPIGGFFPAGAPVAAVARKADQLDLFVVGNDGRVYTSWWGGGNDWSGVNDNWRAIGGFFPVGAPLSAVARTPNNLDVFVLGNDGRVYTSWWSGANDWSGINDNWMVVPPSIRLNLAMQVQQQSNWCWAAVSTSVAAFYDAASTWTQCSVADGELGRTDCCGVGATGPCNVYGTLNTALTRVGHLDRLVAGAASFADVSNAIGRGQPVGVRIFWSGGGAHFIAIEGVLHGDSYAVDDPVSGASDVTETVLKTKYLGTGSWTHTYYTR